MRIVHARKKVFMFNILINNDMFKEEREYFAKNGYECEKVKELEIYGY